MKARYMAAIALGLIACSQAASDGEAVGTTQLPLDPMVLAPAQLVLAVPTWTGTDVELLAADAYYNCTTVAEYDLDGVPHLQIRRNFLHANDKFLEDLTGKMLNLEYGNSTTNYADGWWSARVASSPSGWSPLGTLQLYGRPVPGYAFLNQQYPSAQEQALDTDFRTAGVNLCMAQDLRRHSPGSAANTGLFLPEDQQRQLLEIVRERSQVAMLQYGLFASVLAATPIGPQYPGWGMELARIGEISKWLNHLPDDVLTRMGNDFATSVQLNVMATEEMAQLLARSRSKRDPFGRITADRADAFWGASSWYQREMALFYGGDPLAMETPTAAGAPWKGLVPTPGAAVAGDTWPDASKVQSFHVDLLEPQPQLLLQMARAKGVLKLLLAQANPTPPQCASVDVNASAQAIYDNVEKKLHDEACNGNVANGPCAPWPLPQPPPPDESYWLLTRHRITRAHALTMVTWLAEGLTFANGTCPGGDLTAGYEGAISVNSTIPYNSATPMPTVVWDGASIEIKPHASFEARPLSAVAPLFSRIVPLYLADVSDIDSSNSNVGILGFNGNYAYWAYGWNAGSQAEAKRVMGAVPAHAAAARMLRVAISNPSNSKAGTYLATAEKTFGLARAAAGGTALSLKPDVYDNSAPWGFYFGTGSYRPTLLLDRSTSDIRCDSTDACTLFALSGQPDGADLSAHPDAVFQKGATPRSVAYLTGLSSTPHANGVLDGSGTVVRFPPIDLNSSSGIVSFVLRHGSKYKLIAGNVYVRAGFAYDGQDLAFDGELGTMAARANSQLLRNPVEPAYDGFGWETHWVPPLTAGFLGGAVDQPSVEPMLHIAEQSADEAAQAIEAAVTGLIDKQKDDVQVSAALAKSSQAIKQERDGLCGPSATKIDCDAAAARTTSNVSVSGWYGLAAPTNYDCSHPPTMEASMDCLLQRALQSVEATQVTLAGPVDAVKVQGSAPSFSQYTGGSLQSAFIEQWRAVNSLGGKIRAVQSNNAAAVQSAIAVRSAILAAQLTTGFKCVEGIAGAAVGGFSSGFASATFDPGPLMAAIADCALSVMNLDATVDGKLAEEKQAFSALAAALADMSDFLAALQQSSAKVESLATQAKMGEARAQLDAELSKSTAVTSFPAYRNFRDADLWRARAVVESSRRYALAARRAVEARYVVDLTRLDQKETFVSAPSVWADDIYGYDLSLPNAVGLTVTSSDQKNPSAVYKAAIKDYVANLRGFVTGYAASRPSAIAQDDIDVVNLSGFVPFGSANESPGAWQLLCGANWIGLDAYKNAAAGGWNCGTGSKATRARVGFILDPWGQLNGAVGNEPYTKRYNTRWGRVALNVVGTGVKDCSLAADPMGCYGNSTIRYNLTHVTPTWTTDYDGLWREQDMPLGQIEGGKGLAVELFLNPLKDGWSTSFISAVARTEYLFRPVGGSYNLEIEVTPEVMLQRIERMQLLVGTSAWVKQK